MIVLAMLLALQTQAEMNDQAAQAYAAADAALNAQYQRTMTALRGRDATPSDRVPGVRRTGPSRANALLQDERTWIQSRDAQCLRQGDAYSGGSLQDMVVVQCKTKLTRQRTTRLRALAG